MKIQDLNLKPELLKAVQQMGFTEPTLIQEKCIPLIRAGKDIVAQSSTGSGKTAAFGLPLLEKIVLGKGLQVLVLTPTRELCVQVSEFLQQFGKFLNVRVASVYGGVSIGPQIESIKRADIVVGTPGRILDHLERKTLNLRTLSYLVLDEADKMFEMGFVEAVEKILRHTPRERQTLLFSATIPKTVLHLVNKHLRNPESVKAEIYVDKNLLKQCYYVIRSPEKFSLLVHLLQKKPADLTLIFCATRRETDIVAKNLKHNGIQAIAIHGGLTQQRRSQALESLKKARINVLVATDVAARGLDIKNVTFIYNYDVPKTPSEYTHRIGRTARAGANGEAITLLCEKDYDNFNRVLQEYRSELKRVETPLFQKVAFQRSFMQREDDGRPQHQRFQHGRGRPHTQHRQSRPPQRRPFQRSQHGVHTNTERGWDVQ